MKTNRKMDDACYITGWCVIGVFLFCKILSSTANLSVQRGFVPCLFHMITGSYCPGCGGTRAVTALLNGHLLQSFVFHPLVLYTAVIGGWFMLTQTIERISAGKCRIGLHYRNRYVWIAAGILVVNFLVKNMALLIWHVDLLKMF